MASRQLRSASSIAVVCNKEASPQNYIGHRCSTLILSIINSIIVQKLNIPSWQLPTRFFLESTQLEARTIRTLHPRLAIIFNWPQLPMEFISNSLQMTKIYIDEITTLNLHGLKISNHFKVEMNSNIHYQYHSFKNRNTGCTVSCVFDGPSKTWHEVVPRHEGFFLLEGEPTSCRDPYKDRLARYNTHMPSSTQDPLYSGTDIGYLSGSCVVNLSQLPSRLPTNLFFLGKKCSGKGTVGCIPFQDWLFIGTWLRQY